MSSTLEISGLWRRERAPEHLDRFAEPVRLSRASGDHRRRTGDGD